MRRTALSRSIVAIAALGLGAGTLVAAPANATAPTDPRGITRQQILDASALALKQAKLPEDWGKLEEFTFKACDVAPDRTDVQINKPYQYVTPTFARYGGESVVGVLVTTQILYYQGPDPAVLTGFRTCTTALLATTDPTRNLSGSVDVTSPNLPTQTYALSGNFFASPVIGEANGAGRPTRGSLEADGNVQQDIKQVPVAKSAAIKAAAKKSYTKKVASYKKSYVKAKKKAGKSKAKKRAALKTYQRRKAAAKKVYLAAIAPSYKWVPGVGSPRKFQNTSFSLAAFLSAL